MNFTGFLFVPLLLGSGLALADEVPTFEISIQGHRFQPAEISVPAGKKIKLLVNNQDVSPEEFESYELNIEKVISGGQRAVIYIRPLAPGRYPFFGEFHKDTAKGAVIAK